MTRAILAALCFGLSCGFGYMFYAQHLRWRGCFNDAGRCFDAHSGVVYHAQSGAIWLVLALGAFGLALFQVWRWCRLR